MNDSIEYELTNWEPREVWRCQGACGKYRHRRAIKGILPAVCCGVPAKPIDRYQQPTVQQVDEVIASLEPTDPILESALVQMQASALLGPEPVEDSGKGAQKSWY
jgi:hypothetical protein